MKKIIEVKAGQTWGDLDEGTTDKYWRVNSVGEILVQCTGLETRKEKAIRKDRLKSGSKRYYLAVDNDIVTEVSRLLVPPTDTKTELAPEQKTEPDAKPKPEVKAEAKPRKKSKSAKAEAPPTP